MVHLLPTDDPGRDIGLRARGRDAKRRAFLDEAMTLVDENGLDGLTVKRLAERVGCSAGALYRHFPSKDALIGAMQAEAIWILADAHDRAAAPLAQHLAGLDDREQALSELVAFGSMVVAARESHPCAFGLQQQLLSAAPLGLDPAVTAEVVPVATAMIGRPTSRLDTAQARGWLDPGNAFDRAVTWVAALGGVLQLDRVRHAGVQHFDVDQLARRLTLDLLRGWGADPAALERAAAAVTPQIARDVLATTSLEEPTR